MNNQSTTVLYLQGLAITCFNQQLGRSETVLLRQSEHKLSIKITKESSGITEILYLYTEENGDLARRGITIEINGAGNPQVNGFTKYLPIKFDRLDDINTDANHLKWIIDLENDELHNKQLLPTGTSDSLHNMPLTKMYIQNAHFYTETLTQYKLAKIEKINEVEVSQVPFGRVGVVMAAEIIADEVLINITGKDLISLKPVENAIYKIYIDNLRDSGDFTNDAPEYYKVVQDTENREFDFTMMTSTSGVYNCNEIILGETESLDNFG